MKLRTCSMDKYGIMWWISIISLSISLNEAGRCTDCTNTILGTESENIMYGPSNKRDCQCEWTIPTSMATDHKTAIVLMLQDVSLPMTTGSSTDCSASIRFPGADGAECEFPINYCLAFATASTICNINKIREKIPVANPTCDSIIPWNKAGGSPYKIQYYAGNYADHTKYFTIQYLVIDCRPQTTTPEEETTAYTEIRPDNNTTMIKQSISTAITGSTTQIVSKNPADTGKNITVVATRPIEATSVHQVQAINSTTVIIIAASVAGLIIIVVSALLIRRSCQCDNDDISKVSGQEYGNKAEGRSEREIVENVIYGTSLYNQQGPETIINEIYDTTPDMNGEMTKTDDPCLYAVVQKKRKKREDKNIVTEGNDDIVTVEDDPSSIYAVVNKDKK